MLWAIPWPARRRRGRRGPGCAGGCGHRFLLRARIATQGEPHQVVFRDVGGAQPGGAGIARGQPSRLCRVGVSGWWPAAGPGGCSPGRRPVAKSVEATAPGVRAGSGSSRGGSPPVWAGRCGRRRGPGRDRNRGGGRPAPAAVDGWEPVTATAASTSSPRRMAVVHIAGASRGSGRVSGGNGRCAHGVAVDCSGRCFGAVAGLPGAHAAADAGDPSSGEARRDTAYLLGGAVGEAAVKRLPAATGEARWGASSRNATTARYCAGPRHSAAPAPPSRRQPLSDRPAGRAPHEDRVGQPSAAASRFYRPVAYATVSSIRG
jgi:hypothetical protein